MRSAAIVYPFPSGLDPSPDFEVRVGGQPVFVHSHAVAGYALFSAEGPVEVEVTVRFPFEDVKVRPLRHEVVPEVDGDVLRFRLDGPSYLSLEFDGDLSRPLFLWVDPPDEDVPAADTPGLRFFVAGRVHDVGLVTLKTDETVYIEGGAVVRGAFRAEDAQNVTVRGRGVLDGSHWPGRGREDRGPWLFRFTACRRLVVEGVAAIDSPRWTLVPVGCSGVHIAHVKIITDHVGGDGVDLVGCRDAVVEDCFMRTADDCVAIKASSFREEVGGQNVENIRVRRCVCWDAKPGNALEIGYETRCDYMRDISFEDCDIIHVEHEGHQSGGVLTIHNGDRAHISNVRYEGIRVEDAQEKLIDIKILFARYSRDEERGQVGDILIRDVSVVDGPYPVSIIRGYDEQHAIGNVTIQGLTIHGRPVRNWRDAHMVVELAPRVHFGDG